MSAKRCWEIIVGLLISAWAVSGAEAPTFSVDEVAAVVRFHLQTLKKTPIPNLRNAIAGDYPADVPNSDRYSYSRVEKIKDDSSVLYVVVPEADTKKPAPLWGIKIRQDYKDVVQEEDPSVTDAKARRNQLAGASLSFSRDFLAHNDSWSVKGALVRPFALVDNENGFSSVEPLSLRAVHLIPSVSMHKIDTQGNPKGEVDSLTYRLGASGRWTLINANFDSEIELRASGAYGTDLHHRASIFATGFDIEPRLAGKAGNERWALGFKASLSPHMPDTEHPNDTSNFLYQLRVFGHGEYGRVRDTGGNPDLLVGQFLRFGPVAKLEFQPCMVSRKIGLDAQALTFQVGYGYVPSLSGRDPGHDGHLEAGLEWALLKREAQNQKVSLKLLYEKGGLELTKEEVETFTIGLGITF